MNRREFVRLASLALAGFAGRIGVNQVLAASAQDDDLARVELVEARARQAGIERVAVTRGDLYVAVSNAEPDFSAFALKLCDALADDFLKHFHARHFTVERPKKPMLIVILADSVQLAGFLGENPGDDVRGVYDIDAGWLAICDNRGGSGGPRAERANSIALFHEATHQLCFECGLLEPQADVPLFISEGLATYGEVRRPDGRITLGARNAERIAVLRTLLDRANKLKKPLTPLAELLTQDHLLDDAATAQLAYAQSWAFIHMMMQTDADQKKMASYLAAIRSRRNEMNRATDFEAAFGTITELDTRLEKYVTKLARR
jgi:hypothetical protein